MILQESTLDFEKRLSALDARLRELEDLVRAAVLEGRPDGEADVIRTMLRIISKRDASPVSGSAPQPPASLENSGALPLPSSVHDDFLRPQASGSRDGRDLGAYRHQPKAQAASGAPTPPRLMTSPSLRSL